VFGVFVSEKWLVSLTDEVPLCPSVCESSDGKPTYKSMMKAEAMHSDTNQRPHPPP